MSDVSIYQTILSFAISLVVSLLVIFVNNDTEKRNYLKREKFELYKNLRNTISSLFFGDEINCYINNIAKKKKKEKQNILSFELFKKEFETNGVVFLYHKDSMISGYVESVLKEVFPNLIKLNDLSIGKIRKLTKKIITEYNKFYGGLSSE